MTGSDADEVPPGSGYRVQRWDSAWGGWVNLARAFDDDRPADYATKAQAQRIVRRLKAETGRDHRVIPTPETREPEL